MCVRDAQGRRGRSEQFVGYFYSAPLYRRGLYCLALCIAPASDQPSLFTSAHPGAADSLDADKSRCLQRSQFIEDTVEPSFFLPGIISLFIMCVGII